MFESVYIGFYVEYGRGNEVRGNEDSRFMKR